jgi:hypothetical protein
VPIHTHIHRMQQNSRASSLEYDSLLKTSNILANTCPQTLTFRDTRRLQMGQHIFQQLFVTTIRSTLLRVLETERTQQGSASIAWSWSTHTTNTAICSLPSVHVIVELVLLRYPGPYHADVKVFRQSDWRLRETRNVIPTAHVNAVRSGLYWHQPMKVP